MAVNLSELFARVRNGEISEKAFEASFARTSRPARDIKPALPEGFINPADLPEAFRTKQQGSTLTSAYTQIPLEPILESLAVLNWLPYSGKGALTTIKGRNQRGVDSGRALDTAKHSVTLRNPDQTSAGIQRGDRFVQATLVNAHDGTSPLIFMLGILELVCTNGMTSMRSGFSIRLRHIGLTLDVIQAKFLELAANAQTMLDQARIMSGIKLSDGQALELATRSLPLRWALEVENERHQLIPNPNLPMPSVLLHSLYNRQSEPTLWNIAQNLQRNLLDGGFSTPSSTKSGQRKVTSARGLDAITRINTGVDALCWEFAREEFPEVDLPVPTTILEPAYTVLN